MCGVPSVSWGAHTVGTGPGELRPSSRNGDTAFTQVLLLTTPSFRQPLPMAPTLPSPEIP